MSSAELERWLRSLVRGSRVELWHRATSQRPQPQYLSAAEVLRVTARRVTVEGATGSRLAFETSTGKEVTGYRNRYILPLRAK